jgi:hypothetical protein
MGESYLGIGNALKVLPSRTTPPSTVTELLDLLQDAADGVQVLDPPKDIRAAWRRLLHVLRSDRHIPDGWHLVQRGRDRGDLVIQLRRGPHPSRKYQATKAPTKIVEDLADAHPVVRELREQPQRLPDSDTNRSRTLLLLEAIASHTAKHGYSIKSATAPALLMVGGSLTAVAVRAWEDTGKRWNQRLCLAIDGPGRQSASWNDYSSQPLEAQLPEIMKAVKALISKEEARIRAEERSMQAQLDRERERQINSHRAAALRDQVARWLLAQDIRAHCADLVDGGVTAQDRWVKWASEYADSIDPLRDPPGLPADPPHDTQSESAAADISRATAASYSAQRSWHPNRRWYHP